MTKDSCEYTALYRRKFFYFYVRFQGRAFGVFIGCLLGMCPLLLIDKTNKDGESEVDDVKKTENGNTDRNYIHDSGSRADIDSKRSKHRDEKIVAPR